MGHQSPLIYQFCGSVFSKGDPQVAVPGGNLRPYTDHLTILVFIVLALNIIHFYKTRTSKEYLDKASKMHESKILGVIPVEHPSIKDTLIVFAIAIGLFSFLMFIFLDV
jgi:hypothetical protein